MVQSWRDRIHDKESTTVRTQFKLVACLTSKITYKSMRYWIILALWRQCSPDNESYHINRSANFIISQHLTLNFYCEDSDQPISIFYVHTLPFLRTTRLYLTSISLRVYVGIGIKAVHLSVPTTGSKTSNVPLMCSLSFK